MMPDIDDPEVNAKLRELANHYKLGENREKMARELKRVLGSWDQAYLCLYAWDSLTEARDE